MPTSAGPGGTVFQLSRKSEVPGQRGLPKLPIATARATPAGLEGDFNRYRHEEDSDDPRCALLLMPLETLRQLNAEGWPVRPGDLGENITSHGIAYNEITVGQRYRIGEVLTEVSKPCDPCHNLTELPYVGTAREAEFLRTMHGRRGWYLRVLDGGTLRVDDRIARVTDGATR
ncbi:MAG TPA: MOSC domain-containing protein [Thermoplasmata archaeon]|nr:MOSC domain-containing protein [Thermoplasmata archaeon]